MVATERWRITELNTPEYATLVISAWFRPVVPYWPRMGHPPHASRGTSALSDGLTIRRPTLLLLRLLFQQVAILIQELVNLLNGDRPADVRRTLAVDHRRDPDEPPL